MAVVIYTELSGGKLRKSTLEAATYGYDLAQAHGLPLVAVHIGQADDAELSRLGTYGVGKVLRITDAKLNTFHEAAHSRALAAAAQAVQAQFVVLGQTYNTRPMASRLAIRLDAALFSGVHTLLEKYEAGYRAKRSVYSTKGIQTLGTAKGRVVVTVKANSYMPKEVSGNASLEAFAYTPDEKDFVLQSKQIHKASDKISLTEAEIVVSAGRGLKGPENWGMIEQLAELLGAATASSKPVADIGWRPHHEHVGQTGIQIAPNLYIAVGISGAIQHLAGISASKTIVVINKDAEAPFFKAADFGIVGDAFEVVPKLIAAVKAAKA
ncbi:MAG: electron transfer flavoprotein subunit alpha/FixB family protein [Bacteroidetes bacterium]|jgi:electron transfer flavoprotein alpha subunit|nr:electron transfer flavoprotein subunit alpha/FixB family protein [Bacteroidota bacterium]